MGWRVVGVAGLWCIAMSAQAWACVGTPGIEPVAPGIVRVAQGEAAPAASWAVQAIEEQLPRSGLRVAPSNTDCEVTAHDGRTELFVAEARSSNEVRIGLQPGDRVFGLGDKAGPLDRRGRVFTMWNTDAYAWDAARDPLYKSIPFFIVMREGKAFGVLVDDTQRMTFDVGKIDPDAITFSAGDDQPVWYVIAGPTPRDVLLRYTALTGRTPLPPKWALGFQQSRYTYLPEARVREVAKTLREKKIPADAIWLDIGFQENNKPFTVDRKAFPDFEGMLRDLRNDGFRTVLITDLHIAKQEGYAPYDSGRAADVFVKRDGKDYVGKVWPGDSVFPDFSLARVRQWWGALYAPFVSMGGAGFWNDMNEPSVFDVPGGTMPDDVEHRLDDGTTRTHAQMHNVYGMLNARATYEGLLQLQPNERPFVLTRAAYAGTQRYAATWTGDNTASWHHLGQSVPNILSLGLSGMALAGDDIGGFIGSPPADLLTRWYEVGAWQPLFRSHAATDTQGHEAWVDGPEHEAKRRAAIERRYRLMPYLYTVAEENARTGAPITRPLWFEHPALAGSDQAFLFGDAIAVVPNTSERLDPQQVELPPGAWYGFDNGWRWSNKVGFDPRHEERMAVFVRGGAIVPMQPLVQHTGQSPDGPLQVHVWWPEEGEPCTGALYDDDGTTMAYRRDAYLRIAFSCKVHWKDAHRLIVEAKATHAGFDPWWSAVDVVVHRGTKVHTVRADGLRDWRVDLTFNPYKGGDIRDVVATAR
jgi:alpha-glucosidase